MFSEALCGRSDILVMNLAELSMWNRGEKKRRFLSRSPGSEDKVGKPRAELEKSFISFLFEELFLSAWAASLNSEWEMHRQSHVLLWGRAVLGRRNDWRKAAGRSCLAAIHKVCAPQVNGGGLLSLGLSARQWPTPNSEKWAQVLRIFEGVLLPISG